MTSAQGSGSTTRPLVTVVEVAEVLRLSNLAVDQPIKSGGLPASWVGKNYRIRESELSAGLTDLEEVSG